MEASIVCLANSIKYHNRCVVGKVIGSFNRWIRPVGSGEKGALRPSEIAYPDGSMPQVLDVIKITLKAHMAEQFQTENYVIDNSKGWEKIGVFDRANIDALLDSPKSLWSNHKYYDGMAYRICDDYGTMQLSNSVYFIKTDGSTISVENGKCRIIFVYNGIPYKLPITDTGFTDRYRGIRSGEYAIKQTNYICVTLGLPSEKYRAPYLFAAAVIL